MREEDFVACLGENEVITAAPEVSDHRAKPIHPDDWLVYMAQPLRQGWAVLQSIRADLGIGILDSLTYADWEHFCLTHSKLHPASVYSRWLLASDGL